jgi:hypothetical protein
VAFAAAGCRYTVELDPEVAQAKAPTKKKKKQKAAKKDAYGYEVADGSSEEEQEKSESTAVSAAAGSSPGKRKFVRLVGSCLVDEAEPGNEEAEEDPGAKARDL